MRSAYRFCVALSLLLFPSYLKAQSYLNLDFETVIQGQSWIWFTYGPGYEFAFDTGAKVSGAQSLRIRDLNAPSLNSNISQYFPLADGKGHHLRFSGFIKTDSITQGSGAGLWLRVDGAAQMISLDNAPSDGVHGTTDWQSFTIDRDISPDAIAILIGVFQYGDGTAWFDNLSISVDGAPYPQASPPNFGEPTSAQLDWVRQTANPFFTPDPTVPPDDLWPVGGMVGNAHIIGLGEGTHGSSEFFRMKHRLLEYLAANQGLTVFSIEANLPEAYRLNDYVLNGNGDPRALLRGMYFWTWNTQEVLDMIIWMRAYNQAGKGQIQFTGFDMQYGGVAIQNVRNFVTTADPAYLPTLNAAYALALAITNNLGASQPRGAVQAATDAAQAVRQYLAGHRADYLANNAAAQVDWALQNAVIVEQSTYYAIGGSTYRDACMAANIDWIVQQNPGARVVLWAHDFHISRADGAMGSYLAANHGKDYVTIGQVFHSGQYNAYNNNGKLVANDAVTSSPPMLEYVLHSASMPQFVLDLRQASPSDPGSSWLFGTTLYRTLGAVADVGWIYTNHLTTDYDILIFFEQVTASALLLPY